MSVVVTTWHCTQSEQYSTVMLAYRGFLVKIDIVVKSDSFKIQCMQEMCNNVILCFLVKLLTSTVRR